MIIIIIPIIIIIVSSSIVICNFCDCGNQIIQICRRLPNKPEPRTVPELYNNSPKRALSSYAYLLHFSTRQRPQNSQWNFNSIRLTLALALTLTWTWTRLATGNFKEQLAAQDESERERESEREQCRLGL